MHKLPLSASQQDAIRTLEVWSQACSNEAGAEPDLHKNHQSFRVYTSLEVEQLNHIKEADLRTKQHGVLAKHHQVLREQLKHCESLDSHVRMIWWLLVAFRPFIRGNSPTDFIRSCISEWDFEASCRWCRCRETWKKRRNRWLWRSTRVRSLFVEQSKKWAGRMSSKLYHHTYIVIHIIICAVQNVIICWFIRLLDIFQERIRTCSSWRGDASNATISGVLETC